MAFHSINYLSLFYDGRGVELFQGYCLSFCLCQGPHLLAPTGSDLSRHGRLGTVLAGYHYDFNFLTIHGQSRFPGLAIWTRDGIKIPVTVPNGCLLLQAGKQVPQTPVCCTSQMFSSEILLFVSVLHSPVAAGMAHWRSMCCGIA